MIVWYGYGWKPWYLVKPTIVGIVTPLHIEKLETSNYEVNIIYNNLYTIRERLLIFLSLLGGTFLWMFIRSSPQKEGCGSFNSSPYCIVWCTLDRRAVTTCDCRRRSKRSSNQVWVACEACIFTTSAASTVLPRSSAHARATISGGGCGRWPWQTSGHVASSESSKWVCLKTWYLGYLVMADHNCPKLN